MNEYEYAFTQDVRNKKLTATGARHRATRGTKSFAVHNQSDYLTKKELKAMSGDVHEYNLNKPMRWNQYQLLEKSAKELYLKTLVEEHGGKTACIAEMLGISLHAATKELQQYGLMGKPGVRRTVEQAERWEKFANGEKTEDGDMQNPATEAEEEIISEPWHYAPTSARIELFGDSAETVKRDFCNIMEIVKRYGNLYKITLEVE